MTGRSPLLRAGSLRPGNAGQRALALIGNLCFTLFVIGVLMFTIIAATYEPEDPLFHPSNKISTFLTPTSNATFEFDNTVVNTGEDFMAVNQTAFNTFMNITDVADSTELAGNAAAECENEVGKPIDCKDLEVFHAMMGAAIEKFKDIHFYQFGKPVRGSEDNNCDMAWWFRPKDKGRLHHLNARKRKPKKQAVFVKAPQSGNALPIVGEMVNDSLPVVESEASFKNVKYLYYTPGGDRCKSMNHYLWSFLCELGEAQYLNCTFVMDLNICLSSMYTKTGHDEEGKDFLFYFDFEHLKGATSVLDQTQFWTDWNKWCRKDGLSLHLVEDFRVTPMKLKDVKDTLIIRKKQQTRSSLDRDTSPDALLMTLKDKIDEGRNLYIATNEPKTSFFDALKDKYTTDFLDDYKEFWAENSEWYSNTTKLNNGAPVEFDGYMRISVDTEVFLRGKKQLETFNDLTRDCKDGVNTCSTSPPPLPSIDG
ncbi:hypothetical protein Cgig2_030096 [Carnegiea gigantea]|uniref:Uncharacterized protein n=1 Tax=Carnegiea gigantea TaxID=171969 RepID=A0A9Q1JNV6_9CARY|nr:hypothetical protein Cgig2_030096 [Carnegiea gigantea]